MPGDEQRRKGFSGVVGAAVGAIAAGRRRYDRLIATGFGAGFAGIAFVLLLRAWNADREADRHQREQEHREMVELMAIQHREDRNDRRQDRCVAAQLTDAVRAAIWHERPRPRGDCQ